VPITVGKRLLRESFRGERPNDVDAVLLAIDALDNAGPSRDGPGGVS
jgi:hypothetical protein